MTTPSAVVTQAECAEKIENYPGERTTSRFGAGPEAEPATSESCAQLNRSRHKQLIGQMASPQLEFREQRIGPTGSSEDADADPTSPGSLKRKRTSGGGSVASDSFKNSHDGSTRNFVKRACNECRQQKLRCDVTVESTYQPCSRCKRLKLDCRIDVNFRRVDKRNKTTEMEKELHELRRKLADQSPTSPLSSTTADAIPTPNRVLSDLHQGAADSLLELRHSSTAPHDTQAQPDATTAKRLEKIFLTTEAVNDLFKIYFTDYHEFLPLLDPNKSGDFYYECSELLFWAVISVAARRYEDDPTLLMGLAGPLNRLVWSTMAEVPQNYHIVKAFCLMCSWPVPTKTSSKDPTYMIASLMQAIALQTGLHRPSHVQEYTRVKLNINEDDIKDRLQTWAACTIVMQNISTGMGQPPMSQWDFTLTSLPSPGFNLPPGLYRRLQVERFCNKVSRLVYSNKSDPLGLSRDEERPSLIGILSEDYSELESQVAKSSTPLELVCLKASLLHLRLSAFFSPSGARYYKQELLELHNTAVEFLTIAMNCESLKYAGNYIVQMLLAAGFTLAKLLNSFFARHVDLEAGRKQFHSMINTVRALSINNNDIPARTAEVLTQLWRSMGAGMRPVPQNTDDTLSLKVRARMSLSVVYDSVWRWREQFPTRGDGTTAMLLDTSRPTDPNPSVDPAITDPVVPNPDPALTNITSFNDGFGDLNYELFDPLMSMLDSGVDFGYGSPEDNAMGIGGPMLFQ